MPFIVTLDDKEFDEELGDSKVKKTTALTKSLGWGMMQVARSLNESPKPVS